MTRLMAFCAEVLATYLVLMGLSVLTIWGWRGFDDVGQLLLLGAAVVHVWGAIKVVVQLRLRGFWLARLDRI